MLGSVHALCCVANSAVRRADDSTRSSSTAQAHYGVLLTSSVRRGCGRFLKCAVAPPSPLRSGSIESVLRSDSNLNSSSLGKIIASQHAMGFLGIVEDKKVSHVPATVILSEEKNQVNEATAGLKRGTGKDADIILIPQP